MRKKLLQHTLFAAIAAWALTLAHGGSTAVPDRLAVDVPAAWAAP
ncbi:hypothetical protein [Aquabacterium olei]|nr:hypothetical protein [Aquabacterium olei]